MYMCACTCISITRTYSRTVTRRVNSHAMHYGLVVCSTDTRHAQHLISVKSINSLW